VDRAPAGGEAVYRLTTHVGHGKDTQVADGGIQFRGDRGPESGDLPAHGPADLRHHPE
jgi:hypothetical protein